MTMAGFRRINILLKYIPYVLYIKTYFAGFLGEGRAGRCPRARRTPGRGRPGSAACSPVTVGSPDLGSTSGLPT